MDIVVLKNICKTYPTFHLHDVSFSLERGMITGFIGRNGAGKTTTIKSMLNLIHTDSGEISYFGLPLIEHETEIKQRIGYSTGTVSWYPRKTIREIVGVTRSFYRNWDEEAYRKYLSLFGLEESKKPIELSEGMKNPPSIHAPSINPMYSLHLGSSITTPSPLQNPYFFKVAATRYE